MRKPPNQTADQPASLEAAMQELEAIVQQMETAQLPLEASLAAYQRGTTLLQHCQKALAEIEQQVRILSEEQQLQPYQDE
jgi:exodeoxyribonuclease VII small subunit